MQIQCDRRYVQARRDILDRLHRCLLGNLQIRRHSLSQPSASLQTRIADASRWGERTCLYNASSYTIFPPTTVCSTLVAAIAAAGTVSRVRSNTIRSANLPG